MDPNANLPVSNPPLVPDLKFFAPDPKKMSDIQKEFGGSIFSIRDDHPDLVRLGANPSDTMVNSNKLWSDLNPDLSFDKENRKVNEVLLNQNLIEKSKGSSAAMQSNGLKEQMVLNNNNNLMNQSLNSSIKRNSMSRKIEKVKVRKSTPYDAKYESGRATSSLNLKSNPFDKKINPSSLPIADPNSSSSVQSNSSVNISSVINATPSHVSIPIKDLNHAPNVNVMNEVQFGFNSASIANPIGKIPGNMSPINNPMYDNYVIQGNNSICMSSVNQIPIGIPDQGNGASFGSNMSDANHVKGNSINNLTHSNDVNHVSGLNGVQSQNQSSKIKLSDDQVKNSIPAQGMSNDSAQMQNVINGNVIDTLNGDGNVNIMANMWNYSNINFELNNASMKPVDVIMANSIPNNNDNNTVQLNKGADVVMFVIDILILLQKRP